MNGPRIRLISKQYRFELVAVLAVFGVLSVAAIALTIEIGSLHLEACLDPTLAPARCVDSQHVWENLQTPVTYLRYGAAVLTIFITVFAAAPLVAKEIERGTVVLPWTLGLSRRRWLLERVLVVLGTATLAAVVLGWLLDLMTAANLAGQPLGFNEYLVRGPLIAARVLLAGAIAIAAGAMLGRSLPALLVALMASVALCGALTLGADRLTKASPVVLDGPGLYVDFRERAPDGSLLTMDEAIARIPYDDPSFRTTFADVVLGVPAADAPFVIGRDSAFFVVAALATLGLGVVIVDRRRPA